jgi:hypothetical protein
MQYYPDQRHLLEMTTIRRERMLPEDAIGRVEAREGTSVNLRDIVARGVVSSRYMILEAARELRLKDPTDLPNLMTVEVGDTVDIKTPLADSPGGRGRRVLSPVKGMVAYVGDGRIIVQVAPETVELEAGLDGQIVHVEPGRGLVIESFGALVQGVWGNRRRVIGTLRIEPDDGLESIYGEQLDMQYRGAIVITKRPLKETGLLIMEDQGLVGVIAPSMNAHLIERVLEVKGAVLLTEGFGPLRMSTSVFNLLNSFNGRGATLDAVLPDRWTARRPEVIINPTGRMINRPPRPNVNLTLNVGTTVRLTRPPYAGQVGKIINLPKMPYLLENGLRVPCAQIELITGEKVTIPLANLEVSGR